MSSRKSIINLKGFSIFNSKAKKRATTMPLLFSIDGPSPEVIAAYEKSFPLYDLRNFEELIKRLDGPFNLYQAALSRGRPVHFDEFRCSLGLNLRILLSIQESDLLQSGRTMSIFKLHDLGLREPINPLNANPVFDLRFEMKEAFEKELGSIYGDTSLEALSLVTVIFIVERAISWLEPLLDREVVDKVHLNITAIRLPFNASSLSDLSMGIESNSKRIQQAYIKSSTNLLTGNTHCRVSETSHSHQRKTFLQDPPLSSKLGEVSKFAPGIGYHTENSAYNYHQELPGDALDRWVLNARSMGHEPTLMECSEALKRYEATWIRSQDQNGYAPPPVSASYGVIDHALRLFYQESKAGLETSRTKMPSSPKQRKARIRRDAELLVQAATTVPLLDQPEGIVNRATATPQDVVNGISLAMSRDAKQLRETSTTVPKSLRGLFNTASSPKQQGRAKLTIGSPTQFRHVGSATGVLSQNEMSHGASKSLSHPPRSDSVSDGLHSYNGAIQKKTAQRQPGPPRVAVTTRRRASEAPSRIPVQNKHSPKMTTEGTVVVRRARKSNASHCSAPANIAPSRAAIEQIRVPSQQQQPAGTPHDDQKAKVEALLTQLCVMQAVFLNARDSLTATMGSGFVETVTDIALANGWFQVNLGDQLRR